MDREPTSSKGNAIDARIDDADRAFATGLFQRTIDILTGHVLNGHTLSEAQSTRAMALFREAAGREKAMRTAALEVRSAAKEVLVTPAPAPASPKRGAEAGQQVPPANGTNKAPAKTSKKKKAPKKAATEEVVMAEDAPPPAKPKLKHQIRSQLLTKKAPDTGKEKKYEKKGGTINGFFEGLIGTKSYEQVRSTITHPRGKNAD